MKKIVLIYGLIAGAILAGTFLVSLQFHDAIGFDRGMIVGYTSMVLASLLIFFGVRSYRDNVAGGSVSFGRAAKVGALIALLGSACYVGTWEVIYLTFRSPGATAARGDRGVTSTPGYLWSSWHDGGARPAGKATRTSQGHRVQLAGDASESGAYRQASGAGVDSGGAIPCNDLPFLSAAARRREPYWCSANTRATRDRRGCLGGSFQGLPILA